METVVLIILLLVSLSFILKLTFHRPPGCCSQPLDNGFHCIHDRIRKQPVKDKNRRLAVAT